MTKKQLFFILTAVVSTLLAMSEEPLFRAGIFSDTHLKPTGPSQQLVTSAFRFFRSRKVDMIIHSGDIADIHTPSMYHFYRKSFNEIFPDRKPVELITYADHDIIGLSKMERSKAYAKVKKDIQAANDPFDLVVMKGYPFIVMPWPMSKSKDPMLPSYTQYEAKIAEIEKKFPDKPIFVAEHMPPIDTVFESNFWNHHYIHRLLKKHPRVIHLSGHTHGSMKNEAMIWQGEYTAFNAGTLQIWYGMLTGGLMDSAGKSSHEVSVMEVFPKKVVFRRYCLDDGREYGKDAPWIVRLPYDPAYAPYSPAERKRTYPVPEFPANTQLKTAFDSPFEWLTLTIPALKNPELALLYKVTLYKKQNNGQWLAFARHDCDSNFYKNGPAMLEPVKLKINAGYFEHAGEYRITVSGENFFGVNGKPLVLDVKVPEKRCGKVVFESRNPAKDCKFYYMNTELYKPKNGWFTYKNVRSYLHLPHGVWDSGKRFRLSAEIQTKFDDRVAHIYLTGAKGSGLPELAYGRTLSNNDAIPQRYVWDIRKSKKGDYELHLWWGKDDGKIKFDYIKLEVLE